MNHYGVRVGQVWQSWKKRELNRELSIVDVDEVKGKAKCLSSTSKRTTWIDLRSFHPSPYVRSGFVLLRASLCEIVLECWSMGVDKAGDGCQAPELSTHALVGYVFHNMLKPDGSRVKTSTLLDLDLPRKMARTASGSKYRLGKPDPGYVEACREMQSPYILVLERMGPLVDPVLSSRAEEMERSIRGQEKVL